MKPKPSNPAPEGDVRGAAISTPQDDDEPAPPPLDTGEDPDFDEPAAPPPPPPKLFRPDQAVDFLGEFLNFARGDPVLSYWEEGFIASLTTWYYRLGMGLVPTEKQCRALNEIAAKTGYIRAKLNAPNLNRPPSERLHRVAEPARSRFRAKLGD